MCGLSTCGETLCVVPKAPEKQVAGHTEKAANPTGYVVVVDVRPRDLLEERAEADRADAAFDRKQFSVRPLWESIFLAELSIEGGCPSTRAAAEPAAFGSKQGDLSAHLAGSPGIDKRRLKLLAHDQIVHLFSPNQTLM